MAGTGGDKMKTILISGGSGGIGQALVRAYREEGWRVAFGWHQASGAAASLEKETGAIPIRADLRDEADARRFFSDAMRQLSHLDALIVNAALSYRGLITEMTASAWDELMALNLRSAFLLSREALKDMLKRKQGSILLISSMQGVKGASFEAAYAASKAGLNGLARSLALEYGPSGIRVNCLAPGAIDCGMMDPFSDADKKALIDATPLSRLGTAEDVAKAALFLTSDSAAFITGQVLGVDGGLFI